MFLASPTKRFYRRKKNDKSCLICFQYENLCRKNCYRAVRMLSAVSSKRYCEVKSHKKICKKAKIHLLLVISKMYVSTLNSALTKWIIADDAFLRGWGQFFTRLFFVMHADRRVFIKIHLSRRLQFSQPRSWNEVPRDNDDDRWNYTFEENCPKSSDTAELLDDCIQWII